MVDYTTNSATATTTEQTVRIAAGVAIGGFGVGTAFTWAPSSAGRFNLFGALYGSTGLNITGVASDVIVQATGSISGGSSSISGLLRSLTNFGTIATYVNATASDLVVRNYGSIADDVIQAINHRGNTASIVNAGSIIGSAGAIVLRGTGGNTISNSGTITTINLNLPASLISSTAAGLTLTNNGMIAGGATAITTGAFADSITNAGRITGGIALGDGNDRYDNEFGVTTGVVNLGAGTDTGIGGTAADRINGGAGIDTLFGNAGDDTLDGGDDNDALDGGSGDDTLAGGAGSDLLRGGTGVDRMTGGAGDDIFYVDDVRDRVLEGADGGADTLYVSVNYTLRAGQEVEALVADTDGDLTGLTLTGNEFAQLIRGDAGDNRITGGGGADRLEGLGGDDLYIVSDSGTVIGEAAGGGYDVVLTSTSYLLAANVEEARATVPGGTEAISITGNDGANRLVGNAGSNTLIGAAGADTMIGGAGDDTYFVDNAGDVISDSSGVDAVYASINYTLANNLEELQLEGRAVSGTGNQFDNFIAGNGGNNVLNGRGGLDTLIGDRGADRFVFDVAVKAGNVATIVDFQVSIDEFALDDATFRNIGGAGALDARFFTQGPATTRDHHILYDADTGVLSYDRDGTGALFGAVVFAQVEAETALTAADIVVI